MMEHPGAWSTVFGVVVLRIDGRSGVLRGISSCQVMEND